ncbi:mono/diheme cytochrome c family protein [Hoeflea halophila]|uniref:Mono/diheme cytochrome c family protein n=1 Tax=Hoeflea halophila TaxID=714899 RepID=A0A286I561_9HYPH|nr:cytochrome c [Hoeflea halophila]SOE15191.1 mono/diheme cytochrome c family protein [Hoeflea halophila]
MRRHVRSAGVAAAFMLAVLTQLVAAGSALAQPVDELRAGQELVEINCGNCHAVGPADASPHQAAPAFRRLSERFPMDALEEAFSDGRIYSGHPEMPEFIATPDQADAIIAYIASLQG